MLRAVCILLFTTAAFAAELKVQVTDPRAAVVPGARVVVYPAGQDKPSASQTTTREGAVTFDLPPGEYRAEVLAAGFAAASVKAFAPATVSVHLRVATAAETVVVTATRGPAPASDSAALVSLLDATALALVQPVAVNEAVRYLPGAVVNTAGRRGSQSSLFVRGGESRYNKVVLDGVPVNDPGGIFDFGVVQADQLERIEMARGAFSVLYGSDAMTSVVQLWTAPGRTHTPELRFGGDGGTFGTGRGYASLAGSRGRLDYNLFVEHLRSQGQGVNDEYSNTAEGVNLGVAFSPRASLRLRSRYSNNHSGVQSFWWFNGAALLPPDQDQTAHQKNFLASLQLDLAAPASWQHRLTAYEYNHQRRNQDTVADRGCDVVAFDFLDCYFLDRASINRAGLDYQADWTPRSWARGTLGYEFEVENGRFFSEFETLDFLTMKPFLGNSRTTGLRRNHALYAQQVLTFGRVSLTGGLRFVHNESFGNDVVPRAAVSVLALRGGDLFSGTRLRFAYGEGIKAPRFEESFGISGTFPVNPNPDLQEESSRSLEAGFQQSFARGRHWLSATYYNNQFRNQIVFRTDPVTFIGQYVNVGRSFAHGAEVEWQSRLRSDLTLTAAYVHTSSQVLEQPAAFDPLFAAGAPLLRRPRHSGMARLTYSGRRWGGNLGMTAVGRRSDSDFIGRGVTHAAGYARVDLGAWYALNRHMTAYANVENALNKRYNEVAGYPALKANFRAGMRFRLGRE